LLCVVGMCFLSSSLFSSPDELSLYNPLAPPLWSRHGCPLFSVLCIPPLFLSDARTCTVRVHTCRVLCPCCTCHASYYDAPHPMQVRQVDLPLICCRTRALSKLTSTCCTPPLSTANQCLDHPPVASPLPPLAMLSACPFCLACHFYTFVFKVFVLLLGWSVICYQGSGRGYLPGGALAEGHPKSQSEHALLGVTGPCSALPTLVGGHHHIGCCVPCSLVVKAT